ncbi:MAG: DUF2169 family type VI secretion system accessory protein [Planctomycetota bacterium]|jgi:uncharacterized protein YjbI with pentapeptide repeats
MKVLKPLKLSLLTRCFEQKRRYFLGVGILALHRFSSALASEVDMWKFLPETLGKDAVPDAGMPKSRGEFLVTGSAYQPGGVPRPKAEVRVQVGSLEKTLHVFGDRLWEEGLLRDTPSEPTPFVEMPITWEHAFGGEGFDPNPLGKGFAPVETDDGPVHPLPNVELPTGLLRSKRDRPEPAGMGPIDLMWPQRFSKVGTHDKQWLAERFPGFADDMDWSIFNLAPEDQHQHGPFQGDEQFVIDGMHPQKPRLEGCLPAMAARCFVTQRSGDAEAFREVAMRLTTVWLFPEAERYLLVFHGTHEVLEDDAADILQLLIGAEVVGEPKPVEHYQHVLQKRLDPKQAGIQALRDSDLLPATPAINAAEDEAIAEMNELLKTEGLQRKNLRGKQERQIQASRARLVSLGLDPDVHGPPELPPEEPTPTLEELPELAEKLEAEREQQKEEAEKGKEARKEEVREILLAEGFDADTADTIVAEQDKPICGPPQFTAEGELQRLRAISADCVAMGCPVEEIDQYVNDPDRRQRLVETEEAMRDGYRQMAQHQAAPPRFSGEEAARSRDAALATLQSNGNLVRQNLTGFDLSDLDLQGVDLSGAWLENANLARANLEGANLSEAVLARTDLTHANLTGANLSKANLGLAEIIRTKADGAILSEAILNKARLDGASLRGAKLDSANLMEAGFSATDMSEAALTGITFLKDDLRGLCLAGADLSQCNFIEVDVRGVDFSRAKLESANFLNSTGEGAIFTEAQMAGVRFVQKCEFPKSQFRQAVLNGANLRGTQLAESDFSQAQLAGADLSESDLSRASFYRTFARGALFVKANLAEAKLVSADLMNAILLNADLSSADLRGANLFAADLALVRSNAWTKLDEANMKKARIHPKRDSA